MRLVVLFVSVVASGGLAGCAMTWGLAEPEPAPEPTLPVVAPVDDEVRRLGALADEVTEAIDEAESSIDRAQSGWSEASPPRVREGLEAQQALLERRLVLSVALAMVEAARQRRIEALAGSGVGRDGVAPPGEPVAETFEAVVRQASEQVRAARDRRDGALRSGALRGGTPRPANRPADGAADKAVSPVEPTKP